MSVVRAEKLSAKGIAGCRKRHADRHDRCFAGGDGADAGSPTPWFGKLSTGFAARSDTRSSDLAFRHSEDTARTVVACHQLPQRNGLLGRKSSVPPIVNEEREELLRYGGLRAACRKRRESPTFRPCFAVHQLPESDRGRTRRYRDGLLPACRAVGGSCEGKLPSAA